MQFIREIYPNGMPLVLDAVHEDGVVDPDSVRVFSIIHQHGYLEPFIGEQLPWKGNNLAKRLNKILKLSK
tara:strand:+ start:240 stop:449 length:210 start_codon:yes stop_codon:yes gene_type:complete